MALTQNFKRQNTSANWSLADIGGKVRNVAEVVGAAKGLYDVGKAVYQGVRTVTPLIATAGLL